LRIYWIITKQLFNKSEKFDKIKSQLNIRDLTRRATDDMVASPIEHKQPIIGVA